MDITLLELAHEAVLLTLLERLEIVIGDKNILKKGFNEQTVVYELTKLLPNKLSSIMSSSSDILSFEVIEYLKESGMVHIVSSFPLEKYALTFKGIVFALNLRYGKSLDDQFLEFLTEIDSQYKKVAKRNELNWQEKLAVLTLILSSSTSTSSAINIMNNDTNQELLESALHETLRILEKYPILTKAKKKRRLPDKDAIRGEAPAQFFMRMRGGKNLGRKTGQIYVKNAAGYYLDLEKNSELDKGKVLFLLSLIFEAYNPDIDYKALKNDLFQINEKFFPAFLARDVNLNIKWDLSNKLERFFDIDIWSLKETK